MLDTEPIEYKELEREFFNMFNFIEEQAGVNEREHLKSFIQANFIPKSEIKEAIKLMEDEVDKKFQWEDKPKETVEFERGKGWGWLYALSDLKSTLKLDNDQR